ncbi:MAG: hypothetical protein ABSA82_11290 [Thermacetogeniaceae bacterium]
MKRKAVSLLMLAALLFLLLPGAAPAARPTAWRERRCRSTAPSS